MTAPCSNRSKTVLPPNYATTATSILSEITLPNSNSAVTYNVDITNFGGVEMVMSKIKGLPDNLEYSIGNYEINSVICNEEDNSVCYDIGFIDIACGVL